MSFLGATLPAWRYHLEASFSEAGNYFLVMAVGFVLSIFAVHTLLAPRGSRFLLSLGSVISSVGFISLAVASWLELPMARLPGLFLAGSSAGMWSTVMFQSITPAYRRNAGTRTNRAGMLFGAGCLLTALLTAGMYSGFPVASELGVLAIPAGLAAVWFARSEAGNPRLKALWAWGDFQNPGVVLCGLLLFFQFGNEWSIAGWLPLFLIRRLGMSPRTSLLMLALYWTVLLAGRLVSQWVIARASRMALLAGSLVSALLGTVVLASTNNAFGAVMGVVFAGAGFAPVFPLVARKIGHRFPEYQASVFSGLFSIAMLGGLLAPWTASFFASGWGIEAVMLLPMLGVCAVFVLTLLIMLEAKLSGVPAGSSGTQGS